VSVVLLSIGVGGAFRTRGIASLVAQYAAA
jgi:hypothetical protein